MPRAIAHTIPTTFQETQTRAILPSQGPNPKQFLGQIFGCFLAYINQNDLVLLDMHAAHERVLFERYLSNHQSQPLLIPQDIPVQENAHLWLSREQSSLAILGIHIQPIHEEKWALQACPVWMVGNEGLFISFLDSPFGPAQEALRAVAAQLACRAAIKDGDKVDHSQALSLIEAAEALTDPRCPHGRPIWYRLEKDELFTLIGRHI
jgi:DNA mismatch repair protein MutL